MRLDAVITLLSLRVHFFHTLSYFALIDIGSTHSYIASTISIKMDITAECVASVISIVSPLGQSTRVNRMFKRVSLEIQGNMFPADLIELPFEEFDLILGMDWLVVHRASLACATKRATLRTEKNNEIVMIEERRDYLSNVISILVVEKLVRKGCEAYLALIFETAPAKLVVYDIWKVREFSDVFSKKIPSVAPTREVEFDIDFLSGIAPVFIAPYCMASKELAELEAQL